MTDREALTELQPLLVADLFPELGEGLVELLRSLDETDWMRPTLCPDWRVRDIVAHLLDTACRRISLQRDALVPLSPEQPIESYRDLVGFLNDLNAQWVTAAERLSPRLLTELVEFTEPMLCEVLGALDPGSPAQFPVSWAGESESRMWFDVARELTERWHHQQQIRDAVDAPWLGDPRFADPVFETFMHALPHHYRNIEAPPEATVTMRIIGGEVYAYTLVRRPEGWTLRRGAATQPSAAIEVAERVAWLLFTRGTTPDGAWNEARVRGDARLARPYFETVAVMA